MRLHRVERHAKAADALVADVDRRPRDDLADGVLLVAYPGAAVRGEVRRDLGRRLLQLLLGVAEARLEFLEPFQRDHVLRDSTQCFVHRTL